MRLHGKTAIVTGGASGFGAGIVRKFAAEGAQVMIADLNLDPAQTLAGELNDQLGGVQVKALRADVTSDADVAAMIAATRSGFGALDILINNAGTTHLPQPLEDVTEAEFDTVFAVNCKSVYLAAKHIVPQFKAQGAGVILNVASTAGVSPRPRLNW